MRRRREELLGLLALLVGLYVLLSLLSHDPWDPSFFVHGTAQVKNLGGIVGAYLSDTLLVAFGAGAYLLAGGVLLWALRRLLGRDRLRRHLVALLLSAAGLSVAVELLGGALPLEGGLLGQGLAGLSRRYLSPVGAWMLTAALLACAALLASPAPLGELVKRPLRRPRPRRQRAEATREPLAEPPPVPPPVPAGEGFRLPPLELLQQPQEAEAAVSAEELKADSAILQRKLSDFGLHGKVLRVHSGPVVAMHEFEPAAGVKLQRVVSLAEDLSLALRAPSVRIAPLPGKSTIGIEVPHRMRRTVALRQVLSSEAFRKSTSKLTLALGVDIYGRAVVAELEQMPHLLVAGSTGTGKSVALNTMILSILYKALPQEVKLLLIDPKLLELSAYEAIPHLISPVITSPRAASEALKKMVSEMQRRYRLIAEQGARSIEGYNLAVQPQERLSYIVVFIDELADLMLTAQAEVEDSIVRLAQMARACGIHLVVATQRPSVDVITGIIKANFPARVAFQVSSRVDSRTILDAPGAEQLIGRGDMLLSMPGQKLQRVHGAYVSEAEVRAVADYLRAQGPPDYGLLEALQVPQQGQEASQGQDDLYEQALEVAAQAGEVSISMLQRRLKVGFNRAARLMELMEQEGLVGPPRGAGKPRAFLGRKK